MIFTKVEFPRDSEESSNIPEGQAEDFPYDGITAPNICELDKNVGNSIDKVAIIAKEKINENCNENNFILPAKHYPDQGHDGCSESNNFGISGIKLPREDARHEVKEEVLILDFNNKSDKTESDIDSKTSNTKLESKFPNKRIKQKPKSANNTKGVKVKLESKTLKNSKKSSKTNGVQNCRDIYNLLQQEDYNDLDPKAGWDRRSPGLFSLQEGNLGTPSKTSPLPPISRVQKKSAKNSEQFDPVRSPSWSRVESCDLSFLEDGQDRTDTLDKWLRSSRPANLLPKLERKLDI